jgi:SAM-dependent methyltransferase
MIDQLNVRPGGRYLDLGCGTGNSTYLLAKRIGGRGAIVGVDNSSHALEIAREKLWCLGYPNVEFRSADLNHKTEFDDNYFDGIMASNVMYLMGDPASTLLEIMRILKPGANFVMTNPRQGAKPFEIFKEHLRIKHAEYRRAHQRKVALMRLLGHAALRTVDFAALLPFQIILRNLGVVSARFWDEVQWREAIDSARTVSPSSLLILDVRLDYGKQNYTFLVNKP